MSGSDIEIYGDGHYLRDFVHIDDVVRAFLIAGAGPVASYRCFNVASGTGTRLRDAVSIVVEQAARRSGRAAAIRETPWPADAHPIEGRNFIANIDRIRQALLWTPRVAIADGITRLVDAAAAGCTTS